MNSFRTTPLVELRKDKPCKLENSLRWKKIFCMNKTKAEETLASHYLSLKSAAVLNVNLFSSQFIRDFVVADGQVLLLSYLEWK